MRRGATGYSVFAFDCRINPAMADLKPLALTDEQLALLIDTAAQLHALDRSAFLVAVAERFAGRVEIGEGEFARGVRELLQTGRFKWVLSRSAFAASA
jgi:hypothetical protein